MKINPFRRMRKWLSDYQHYIDESVKTSEKACKEHFYYYFFLYSFSVLILIGLIVLIILFFKKYYSIFNLISEKAYCGWFLLKLDEKLEKWKKYTIKYPVPVILLYFLYFIVIVFSSIIFSMSVTTICIFCSVYFSYAETHWKEFEELKDKKLWKGWEVANINVIHFFFYLSVAISFSIIFGYMFPFILTYFG